MPNAHANVSRRKDTGSTSRTGGVVTPPIRSGGEISLGAPVLLSELDNLQSGGATHIKSIHTGVPVASVTKIKDARSGGVTSRIPSEISAPTPVTNNDSRSGGVTPTPTTVKDVLLAHLQTITEMLSNPPSTAMVNTSNGREAMALARSTTMAPLVLGSRSELLHPKLATNGRPMTTAEVHSKLVSPDMTVDEVQNILTAWTENEVNLRRRGGEARDLNYSTPTRRNGVLSLSFRTVPHDP